MVQSAKTDLTGLQLLKEEPVCVAHLFRLRVPHPSSFPEGLSAAFQVYLCLNLLSILQFLPKCRLPLDVHVDLLFLIARSLLVIFLPIFLFLPFIIERLPDLAMHICLLLWSPTHTLSIPQAFLSRTS